MKAVERAIEDVKPYEKKVEAVTVRIGDPIEVLIDRMWWHATVTGISGGAGGPSRVRARLFGANTSGDPATDAILPAALYDKTWRLSTLAVHRVPLTGQGVRNLNLAAPPALRNGRHFRKPANWIAICPHPEELRDDELIEEPIFFDWVRDDRFGNLVNEAGQAVPYRNAVKLSLFFRACNDCGAEVPA